MSSVPAGFHRNRLAIAFLIVALVLAVLEVWGIRTSVAALLRLR